MKDILIQALLDSGRIALALLVLFAVWFVVKKGYEAWQQAWKRLMDHMTYGWWWE